MAGQAPISGASHGPRRGIVVSGFPPASHVDQDTLEVTFYKALKGDTKCGVPEISSCHFTEDMQRAYVEIADPAGRLCVRVYSCAVCTFSDCYHTTTIPPVRVCIYGVLVCHCSRKLCRLSLSLPLHVEHAVVYSMIIQLVLSLNAAITCLLQRPVILSGHTLSIEEIDLNQVYRPYLIVRGLPPFMNQQTEFLKTHFETLSNAQIQSIEFKGEEVLVHFVNPTGMLLLNSDLINLILD